MLHEAFEKTSSLRSIDCRRMSGSGSMVAQSLKTGPEWSENPQAY